MPLEAALHAAAGELEYGVKARGDRTRPAGYRPSPARGRRNQRRELDAGRGRC